MSPSLPEVLAAAVPFAVPLRVGFRGVTRRVGLLLPGPAGWGEFAPFDDYPAPLAARWLAAALEAAHGGWPQPVRHSVAVNAIVPAVPPQDVSEVLRRGLGRASSESRRGGTAASEEESEVLRPGAQRRASDSSPTIKVKVTGDLDADTARVSAVRAAVGSGARIRLDVNATWSLDDALRQLPLLAQAAHGLEYVEQPLASLTQMAHLRTVTGIPVAVDESLRLAPDPFDPALIAQIRDSADVAVLKVTPLGGVRAVLRLAEQLDMPIVISGALDTSVGLAAGIAAACALPTEPLACGLGTGALLAGDVIAAPVVPRDGRLSPMRVAPDPAALAIARGAVTADEEADLRQRLARAWEHR